MAFRQLSGVETSIAPANNLNFTTIRWRQKLVTLLLAAVPHPAPLQIPSLRSSEEVRSDQLRVERVERRQLALWFIILTK